MTFCNGNLLYCDENLSILFSLIKSLYKTRDGLV